MAQFRSGPEFVVNTTTMVDQTESSVAALPDGRFIVVWTDESTIAGPPGTEVRAQIYTAGGSRSGNEFLVNRTTSGNQSDPSVAALSNGEFVVSWTDESQTGGDTSGTAIRAQRVSASGSLIGNEVLVNETTAGNQSRSGVVPLSDGRILIGWITTGSENPLRFQLVDSDLSLVGSEFLTEGDGDPRRGVAPRNDGGFSIVSRLSGRGTMPMTSIALSQFATNGQRTVSPTSVVTFSGSAQFPSIVTLSSQHLVLTWAQFRGVSFESGVQNQYDIYASIFAPDGTRIGPPSVIATTTYNGDLRVTAQALAGDRFVITWTDTSGTNGDSSGSAIRGQIVSSNGVRVGSEFLVNTTTADNQSDASVAPQPDGRFIVTWTDASATGGDTVGTAIRGQIFVPGKIASIGSITDNVGDIRGQLVSGDATDDTSLVLAGTISSGLAIGEAVAIYDGVTRLGEANVMGTSWSYTDITLTNGDAIDYFVVVESGDGPQGLPSRFSVSIDTQAPTNSATITSVSDNIGPRQGTLASGGTSDDIVLEMAGTVSAALVNGEFVSVYDGSTRLGSATVSGTNWTYADFSLAIGDIANYSAVVEDRAGNRGAQSAAFNVSIIELEPFILTTGDDIWSGGWWGPESVQALSGNDRLNGGLGNDHLDGGEGNDIAIFWDAFAQYSFHRNSDGSYTVTSNSIGSFEGSDTVINIEQAQFSDQTRAFNPSTNPVYRFFSSNSNDHFYTASYSEYQSLLSNPNSTYVYEGAQWMAPDQAATTTDVYRFYNFRNGEHFYTTSTGERDHLIRSYDAGTGNYRYEGAGFQVYSTNNTGEPGAYQTDRFYNTIHGVHHFSASAGETQFILSGGAGPGWVSEGPGLVVALALA